MLPEAITQLRESLGLTMSELAGRLKVPAPLIVDWESGQKFPTKRHADALCALKTEAHGRS